MAVLEIKQYPEAVLRRKAKRVEAVTPELRELIDDMIETMYDAPGVGLAAPQIGISLRLAVIDVGLREEGTSRVYVLINPEFISQEGEQEDDEGCLSIHDYHANVKRFSMVRVRATDRDGNSYEIEGEGLLARALQHEIDHLNGMLFIDRLSPLKRDLFKRRYKKQMKEGSAAS